jgi:hypothetical protein
LEFFVCPRSGIEDHRGAQKYNTIRGNKIIELAVPFNGLGLKPGKEARMVISIHHDGLELKRYPSHGFISFQTPDETFHMQTWSV